MPKGHSAGMDVEFLTPPTLRAALAALIANGWSPKVDGCIQYLPAGTPSRMDWERMPADCWPSVLAILEENHSEGNLNRLVMRFKKTSFDAAFEFFQGGDITVDMGLFRPRLRNCCGFTDTNWLLSHVAAPLANLGAIIDKVRFSEIGFANGQTGIYSPADLS